jgi:hypothetical protein
MRHRRLGIVLIRTHTVCDAGDRNQEPGARTAADPDYRFRHRRPVQHPTSIALAAPDLIVCRDDRRLAGCQNPLHVSKNRRQRQVPGTRTSLRLQKIA